MDFVLKLSEAHLNVIIEALARKPYGDVASIFSSIGAQINEQQAAKSPKNPTP
jgi:hypothetical protein